MGRGVLAIALAVDSFPFSCFKLKAAETVSTSLEDIALVKCKHAKRLMSKIAISPGSLATSWRWE